MTQHLLAGHLLLRALAKATAPNIFTCPNSAKVVLAWETLECIREGHGRFKGNLQCHADNGSKVVHRSAMNRKAVRVCQWNHALRAKLRTDAASLMSPECW